MNKTIYILFFTLTSVTGFAQPAVIRVIDATTRQPIPNAHVCAESTDKSIIGNWITNTDGVLNNPVQTKSKVAISFIGYQTLVDSVVPGKSYIFKMYPDVEEIEEVVITGQFKPQTTDKSIYNVQVINKLDIQNKAANTLSDLLSSELNIRTENKGVLGTGISMQGLSGEHIKILIDGVPVVGRQNGNIDLNQLNLQNIDHVEIIEGPMSVIYGSNALGGAINLITKNNTRPKFNIGAQLFFETVGNYNADFFITKNINNNHFNLTAGRNFFDGYSPNDHIRHNPLMNETNNESTNYFNPKQQYTATFDYAYAGKKIKLNAKLDYFDETLRNLGAVQSYTDKLDDTTRLISFYANDEYHLTNRSNAKYDLNYNFNDSAFINFVFAYGYYHKIKQTKRKNLSSGTQYIIPDATLNDTTTFHAYFTRGVYTQTFKNIEINGGYDMQIETGQGKRITDTKRIDDIGVFSNVIYRIKEKTELQGGLRYIYNSNYDAPVVANINLKYQPVKSCIIRLTSGTGFRSPSLKELYLNFVDLNHNISGNPNLEAERSRNLNLSAKYTQKFRKSTFNYSLKFYHTQLKNMIGFLYYKDDLTRADYVNINGWYKTLGSQFDITYKLHPRFEFSTGINYYGNSTLENLNNYSFTADYLASLNYTNIMYLFKVNIYYKYNGEQHQFVQSQLDAETEISESYLGGYHMMDITLSRPFFSNKINVTTGIKNLFDITSVAASGGGQAHSGNTSSSSLSWGRTLFINLKYNFTKF